MVGSSVGEGGKQLVAPYPPPGHFKEVRCSPPDDVSPTGGAAIDERKDVR